MGFIYKEGMSREEQLKLGLVLQHEAYRNGVDDGLVGQFEAAYRSGDRNAVAAAQRAMGEQVLDNYVISADYWKVMDNGRLYADGTGWLTDERGNAVKNSENQQIGADKMEEGLLNILYGGTSGKSYRSFTDDEKLISNLILADAGIGAEYSEGKYGIKDAQWDKTSTNALNMDYVMGYTGGTIAGQVFARYYDSTVDAQIAALSGKDIGEVATHTITAAATEQYTKLYNAKSDFYNSAGPLVDSANARISGTYKEPIYKEDGSIDTNYYKNYKFRHYGIDIGKGSDVSLDGANVLGAVPGKIESNSYNTNEGWTVHTNYGFNFEDLFISTGIYGEYGHLTTQSPLKVGSNYTSNTIIGTVGNTGEHSTGTHLHYSVYTMDSINYSDIAMKILFGNDYHASIMSNGYSKNVFNPTYFYNNNRRTN